MNLTDPVADMLARIRNAIRARHQKVDVPASKLKLEIARILKEEGYISNFKPTEDEGHKVVRIYLKYDNNNDAAISNVERVSRPGCRVYVRRTEIPRVLGGMGINILTTPRGIRVEQQDGHLVALRENDSQAALHGLTRALVNNAVEGVTRGWTRELEIVGIGYRAEMKGKATVVFTLGYSHPIEYPLPTGVDVAVDPKQTRLTVTGIDRQKVGQVAAEMRSLRPPDPYKNKGVRYAGERLKKKVGKTGAK